MTHAHDSEKPSAPAWHSGPPLTVAQLATRWATSEQVVRRLLKDGELRGFKVGRAWRVFPDDAERYIDSRTNEQVGQGGQA